MGRQGEFCGGGSCAGLCARFWGVMLGFVCRFWSCLTNWKYLTQYSTQFIRHKDVDTNPQPKQPLFIPNTQHTYD